MVLKNAGSHNPLVAGSSPAGPTSYTQIFAIAVANMDTPGYAGLRIHSFSYAIARVINSTDSTIETVFG
jgi:hypothetical protein